VQRDSTQSLSNRSLASGPPRQFCDQMSPSRATTLQKGLAIGRHWSGTVRKFRAPKAPRDPAPPAASPRWGFGGAARRRETAGRISMSKPAKKRPTASAPATVPTTKSSRHGAGDPEPKRAAPMAPACQSFLDNVVARDRRHLIAELPRRITRERPVR
jgi:hypothetical protein